jgi:hypothetical protein
VSKIARRNFVKKSMDKQHRPEKHMSDRLYSRKDNARVIDEGDIELWSDEDCEVWLDCYNSFIKNRTTEEEDD